MTIAPCGYLLPYRRRWTPPTSHVSETGDFSWHEMAIKRIQHKLIITFPDLPGSLIKREISRPSEIPIGISPREPMRYIGDAVRAFSGSSRGAAPITGCAA